jgi:hypothetical protein
MGLACVYTEYTYTMHVCMWFCSLTIESGNVDFFWCQVHAWILKSIHCDMISVTLPQGSTWSLLQCTFVSIIAPWGEVTDNRLLWMDISVVIKKNILVQVLNESVWFWIDSKLTCFCISFCVCFLRVQLCVHFLNPLTGDYISMIWSHWGTECVPRGLCFHWSRVVLVILVK